MVVFAPMRTGQLVVRYHSPWRRRGVWAAAAIVAVLLFYGIFEFGRFVGGYSTVAQLQQRRELNTAMQTLELENDRLRSAVAAMELARNVDGKAYSDVEKDLADLQGQLLKQREELTFYRGIVSPEDGIGGLRVQRFEILPGEAEGHFLLRVVLVQSMRQEVAVSGRVKLQIEGTRGAASAVLSLAEAGGAARSDGQLPFKFRYFQNLEHEIVLPSDFEPRLVNVEVTASKLAPVRESYPWQVQAEP
jgi:hypothetical protein